LKGEKIPLQARIVAVADSFDAMTTERPYRQELLPEQALKEILSGQDIQYDPLVVEAFQHVWNAGEITEIFQAFP
jgi:HD-GYP domain-containing protein (c-di-GMP phosphodiesterase class II)